jgi:hypothetical protein
MPDCRIELLADATSYDPICVIGEIAHIEASSDGGPRANTARSIDERDQYDNLILLCQNCHARIDGQPNSYTVEQLRSLRNEHEAWVRASLPERGRSKRGWVTLLLQGAHPIDTDTLDAALSPDFMQGAPVQLTANGDDIGWRSTCKRIADEAHRLLAEGDPFNFRVAVFPLAPVSACIALGYHLTNRPHVRLFQYHRDEHTWQWPRVSVPDDITVEGLPDAENATCRSVAILVHLSCPLNLLV